MRWHVNDGDWQKFTGWDAESGRTGLPWGSENSINPVMDGRVEQSRADTLEMESVEVSR